MLNSLPYEVRHTNGAGLFTVSCHKNMYLQLIRCIILLTLAYETISIDLCSNNNSDITSYSRNVNSQRCGCETNKCIRRCCTTGFSLDGALCVKNNSSDVLKVPLYTDKTVVLGVLEISGSFKVGVMQCPFYVLNNSNHEDVHYVQENGDLWVYNEFVSNDLYCLDDLDGFRVFLCFPETEKILVVGMSNNYV